MSDPAIGSPGADRAIRSVVIVGGGTAGWMSASILARFVDPAKCSITLIESEEIGTVGVGEATVPLMQHFNGVLGIDEREFVMATNATFKLGIEFRDWGTIGNVHFNGFGDFGDSIEGVSPHHHWLRLRQNGDTSPIEDYSFPYAAGRRNRFAPPSSNPQNPASHYKYAFHFDALLYARFLRTYAEAHGVKRVEGRVVETVLDGANGNIATVTLGDGRSFAADLFIDCSGFGGLLIEQALKTGYDDWTHWLPCDRAVVVPTTLVGSPTPYTVSTAQAAGWQWRIPLQHREGNGYVYSSRFADDATARETLLRNVKGTPLLDPRILRFVTGRRRKAWNRNCIAIGLASGFMEPLELTSIQLIQTGIARVIEMFPDRNFDPVMIDEYNRVTANEYERIRDFLVLHYCLTKRSDAPLWDHCRTMALPDTLQQKIDVWKSCGRVALLAEESYQEPNWVAIFAGNNVLPQRYDPLIDRIDLQKLQMGMQHRRQEIARAADAMPEHGDFIRRMCPAKAA